MPNMDKQRVIMFYELCRLCLEDAGAMDIFEMQDLVQDIYTCTAVKVSKKDNLPQKICTKCCDIIQNAKKLRMIAMKNDSHLRSLFNDDEDQTEHTMDVISISSSSQTNEVTESTFFIKDNNTNSSSNVCQTNDKDPNIQAITVRKDIFESSSAVSSSTTQSAEEKSIHSKSKPDEKFPRPIKVEKNLNDLKCDVCNKPFETYKKLHLHQRLHLKKNLCPLDACGKKFATKGDLEKHVRTHTGEKPFKCEVCDRRFAQRGTLKSHRESLHLRANYLLGK